MIPKIQFQASIDVMKFNQIIDDWNQLIHECTHSLIQKISIGCLHMPGTVLDVGDSETHKEDEVSTFGLLNLHSSSGAQLYKKFKPTRQLPTVTSAIKQNETGYRQVERGSLEICGLEFRKDLCRKNQTVMRNCGSVESFPVHGNTMCQVPELGVTLVSCKNQSRGTGVEEGKRRRRVAGNEMQAGARLHRALVKENELYFL